MGNWNFVVERTVPFHTGKISEHHILKSEVLVLFIEWDSGSSLFLACSYFPAIYEPDSFYEPIPAFHQQDYQIEKKHLLGFSN